MIILPGIPRWVYFSNDASNLDPYRNKVDYGKAYITKENVNFKSDNREISIKISNIKNISLHKEKMGIFNLFNWYWVIVEYLEEGSLEKACFSFSFFRGRWNLSSVYSGNILQNNIDCIIFKKILEKRIRVV